MQVRAGLKVKHQSGKAWGHQTFQVFLKGKRGPYYGKKFLPKEQDALPQSGLFWGTVTWVPPKEVGPDDTFKGFFRVVHVAGRVHVNDITSDYMHASA